MKTSKFTQMEWEAWAGAESPIGDHPRINYDASMDGQAAVVVIDAVGISVEEIDSGTRYWKEVGFDDAKEIVEILPTDLTSALLNALSFQSC